MFHDTIYVFKVLQYSQLVCKRLMIGRIDKPGFPTHARDSFETPRLPRASRIIPLVESDWLLEESRPLLNTRAPPMIYNYTII